MAPDIPWQVFAWLITSMIVVGTGLIGWAVWRGNQTAKIEALAQSFKEHLVRDEKVQDLITQRLETVGTILNVIEQRQAVIMDRLGIQQQR